MNLRDVQIFAEAADLGSFTAVARARHSDPSSISRVIAGLEDELGVKLFDRTTRRVTLTPAGELYRSRVVPLIEEIERLSAKARDAAARPSGTLRLSAPVALGQRLILPRLKHFREANPDLRVECLLTDATPDIAAERIDLALRLTPAVTGDLVSTELADTGMRAVASPGYLAGRAAIFAPRDLANHDCLLPPEAEFGSRWLFRDRTGQSVAQAVEGTVSVTSLTGRLAAAEAGLGIALLPGWLVDGMILSGALGHVLPDWNVTATQTEGAIWIAYPAREVLPGKTRAAMEFLRRAV
ncbi:LysR family transcriptional regulator [Rhodobacterales bacterium HKCCE2091]|nr:LysR family transcriptional regulator [Rhodobacterales bacterium HKCCE2091]